jgi:hypothetical protein
MKEEQSDIVNNSGQRQRRSLMTALYIIVRGFCCQHTGSGQLVLISKYSRCAILEYYTLCRSARLTNRPRANELSLTFSSNVLGMLRDARHSFFF